MKCSENNSLLLILHYDTDTHLQHEQHLHRILLLPKKHFMEYN